MIVPIKPIEINPGSLDGDNYVVTLIRPDGKEFKILIPAPGSSEDIRQTFRRVLTIIEKELNHAQTRKAKEEETGEEEETKEEASEEGEGDTLLINYQGIDNMYVTTMKRSTAEILYVTPGDFDLACKGVKTATSRFGDRRELWPVGSVVRLTNNESEELPLYVEIVYNVLMTLGEISEAQAGNICGYSVEDHFMDFTGIYGGDNETELSLVGFRVI